MGEEVSSLPSILNSCAGVGSVDTRLGGLIPLEGATAMLRQASRMEKIRLTNARPLTLMEAVELYVKSLRAKDSGTQQHLVGFVRWMGGEHRRVNEIQPSEIGDFGEQTMGSGTQAVERLQSVRKFLAFAKRKELTDQNLAQHLRIRKSRRSIRNATGDGPRTVEVTREGHQALVKELEQRKSERGLLASEIKRAASDKDVRENAPLEAARERQGLNEARILEIEDTLKTARVSDGSKSNNRTVGMGTAVLLKDVKTGRETTYTVVSAMEASPLEGKISDVSPVGRALIRKAAGQDVEVKTPRGTTRYRIVKVSS